MSDHASGRLTGPLYSPGGIALFTGKPYFTTDLLVEWVLVCVFLVISIVGHAIYAHRLSAQKSVLSQLYYRIALLPFIFNIGNCIAALVPSMSQLVDFITTLYEAHVLLEFFKLLELFGFLTYMSGFLDALKTAGPMAVWTAPPLTCCFCCIPREVVTQGHLLVIRRCVSQYRIIIVSTSLFILWTQFVLVLQTTKAHDDETISKIDEFYDLLETVVQVICLASVMVCVWALFVLNRILEHVGKLQQYKLRTKIASIKVMVLIVSIVDVVFGLIPPDSVPVSAEASAMGWTSRAYLQVINCTVISAISCCFVFFYFYAFNPSELAGFPTVKLTKVAGSNGLECTVPLANNNENNENDEDADKQPLTDTITKILIEILKNEVTEQERSLETKAKQEKRDSEPDEETELIDRKETNGKQTNGKEANGSV